MLVCNLKFSSLACVCVFNLEKKIGKKTMKCSLCSSRTHSSFVITCLISGGSAARIYYCIKSWRHLQQSREDAFKSHFILRSNISECDDQLTTQTHHDPHQQRHVWNHRSPNSLWLNTQQQDVKSIIYFEVYLYIYIFKYFIIFIFILMTA